jgi:hypothetical protein
VDVAWRDSVCWQVKHYVGSPAVRRHLETCPIAAMGSVLIFADESSAMVQQQHQQQGSAADGGGGGGGGGGHANADSQCLAALLLIRDIQALAAQETARLELEEKARKGMLERKDEIDQLDDLEGVTPGEVRG